MPTPKEKEKLRSKRLANKAAATAKKGKKAVDEGRDGKATRLLKKAARQETRSIKVEEREKKKVARKKAKIDKKSGQAKTAAKAGNLKKANRKQTAANRKETRLETITGKQIAEKSKKGKMAMTKKVVKKKPKPVEKY